MLQKETVSAETLDLIQRLMADSRLNDFLLAGGTALALNIGHRLSIDIDLFSNQHFDASEIARILADDYNARITSVGKGSINCFIEDVKVDLISHRYPLVTPAIELENIRMMSLEDIAAMKLHAIVNSEGSRQKDFVDVYFLLEQMPLLQMFQAYEKKYAPHSSSVVARIGLVNQKVLRSPNQVVLLSREFDDMAISQRIYSAIQQQSKIFEAPKLINRQDQSKRKGRRL